MNGGWLVAGMAAASLIVALYALSLTLRRRRLEQRLGELDRSLR